ncbi:hypothetical protein F4819DRAFT_463742 [Hypoxylon fuscum]|nr:hypothetical protein F4819DRAFT_463742 [Hypoxylon fuscum]
MMKLLSLFIFPVLLKAEKYKYGLLEIPGGSIPPGLDAYTSQLITNAQQHPNVTRGIQFYPFGAEGSVSAIPAPKDVQWTWRVNVSDFSAPNADGWDPAKDPHVVTSTYDFTWPGGGNLSAALGVPNAGICVTVADSPLDWPVNVTNTYTEDDTDSNSCAGTLGQACVDAILDEERNSGHLLGDCRLPPESWFALPQCQDTLGYASVSYGFAGIASRGLGFLNSSSNATRAREDGEAWFGTLSAPQYGSGSAEYYTVANRLHIAVINPILPTEGPVEGGFSQGPQLMCMRVNATKLPVGDPNGDGITWTSEAVLESGGSPVKLDWVWVLFTVALASLAFVTK